MGNKTKKIYGKAIVTIEDLMVKYLQFVKLETPTKITTASVANCYGATDTSSDAFSQLAVGIEVALAAQEPGAYASWYVIQDDQGDLFFVGKQLFN